jgi:hypothetical protein
MMLQPGTKFHDWGECKIILSHPFEDLGWHMSISHANRYPTWDEIRDAWYALVPNSSNRVGALMLPKKRDYINIHENCFQVMELKDK